MRIPLFCVVAVIVVACYQSKEADAPSSENDDRLDIDDSGIERDDRLDIDDSGIERDAESGQHCIDGSTDPECTVESSASTDTEINKGERLLDLFRRALEMFCLCVLPDDDSCITNFDVQFDQSIDCIVDVFDQEGEAVEQYVDCITAHFETYSDCVQQHGCDSFLYGKCESEMATSFNVFADSCDEYPNPVYAEMRECFLLSLVGDPGSEVSCMSGENIPYSQICDGEPDCSDGSDEMYCTW